MKRAQARRGDQCFLRQAAKSTRGAGADKALAVERNDYRFARRAPWPL
jgi:hypothetical protein